MAEKMGSNTSRSVSESPHGKRVEITIEPENKLSLENTIDENPQIEVSDSLAIFQEALNFDLENASAEQTLANNIQLRYLLYNTTELLKEKSTLCRNLERQISTLELQTHSLKNLLSITKDLLAVRNTEVSSLHDDMRSMEEKMNEEREKHRDILSNLNASVEMISSHINYDNILNKLDLIAEVENDYKMKIECVEEENKLLSRSEKNGEGDTEVLTMKFSSSM